MSTSPFAVFVFAQLSDGSWAATTRAADRGEAGRIGLPGGKVDAGEDPRAAALREAAEEGWAIEARPSDLVLVHEAEVEGRPVAWFAAPQGARVARLSDYKEAGRIRPIRADLSTIARSGYGNDKAVAALQEARHG